MSTVERTVQLLRDSERRLLCGVGHSGVSAIVAKHQLLRVGVHCECHIDSHFASMIAASLGLRDLYLCFRIPEALKTWSVYEDRQTNGS